MYSIRKLDIGLFFRSDFIKNTSKLFTAGFVSQLIGFAIYPILTRYFYCQSDFGLLRVLMSVANIALLLSTLEYQNAIPLPSQKKEALSLMQLCLISLISFSFLLLLLLPPATSLADYFHKEALSNVIWVIPFIVFFMGVWQILLNWNIRNQQFGCIARYQIGESFFSVGAKCLFGILRTPFGLVYGVVIGTLLGLITSYDKKNKFLISKLKFDWEDIRRVMKKYKNFPFFSLLKSLLNTLSGNLPEFMLTVFFGTHLIGLWGMSMTLAFTPIALLSKSFYQVLFEKMSRLVHVQSPLLPTLKKFIIHDLLVVVPLFFLLSFFTPKLTQLILGTGWEMSGVYIRYLLPWLAMITTTTALNFIPDLFLKQRQMMYFEIIYFFIRFSALFVGIVVKSFSLAVGLYAMGNFIVLLAQLIWFVHLVKQYDNNLSACISA